MATKFLRASLGRADGSIDVAFKNLANLRFVHRTLLKRAPLARSGDLCLCVPQSLIIIFVESALVPLCSRLSCTFGVLLTAGHRL